MKQSGRTVAEYEIEFSRLARFVPQFTTVDADRAARFVQGLHTSLQKFVAASKATTYAAILESALRIEAIETLEKRGKKRQKLDQQGNPSQKPYAPSAG